MADNSLGNHETGNWKLFRCKQHEFACFLESVFLRKKNILRGFSEAVKRFINKIGPILGWSKFKLIVRIKLAWCLSRRQSTRRVRTIRKVLRLPVCRALIEPAVLGRSWPVGQIVSRHATTTIAPTSLQYDEMVYVPIDHSQPSFRLHCVDCPVASGRSGTDIGGTDDHGATRDGPRRTVDWSSWSVWHSCCSTIVRLHSSWSVGHNNTKLGVMESDWLAGWLVCTNRIHDWLVVTPFLNTQIMPTHPRRPPLNRDNLIRFETKSVRRHDTI